MAARVRAHLSYANVIATLALFIALGGSAYAVSHITSSDVKNRSLKGRDIKRNTLTGKEIRERRLGEVPNARVAGSAGTAATADVAKSADRAGAADFAGLANDAQALSGQGAGAFERSSRIAYGRAPGDPAGESGEQALLSWPELGVEVRTATNQATCGAGDIRLGFRNTKSSGPTAFVFEQGNENAIDSVPAGAPTSRECSVTGTNGQITDSSGRTLFFQCRIVSEEARCLGVRSEP